MKLCPSCRYENPDSAKFCSMCGSVLSFRPTCPYCGASVPPKAQFCNICGMSMAPDDEPVEFEIETAFWLSHKDTLYGQQEYLKRYPEGFYKNEIDYEAIMRMNKVESPEEKQKRNRRETIYSSRKFLAIIVYVIAFTCFLLFLIFGCEGVKLLGIPSGAGFLFLGRLIDPDV